MPVNEGLAYISLLRCASKLARSSATPSTNSLKWPAGRRQNRKLAEPEFFQLSDAGLVKGEILALLSCTCMRVGKSRPPSVTEIWSQIATGCSSF